MNEAWQRRFRPPAQWRLDGRAPVVLCCNDDGIGAFGLELLSSIASHLAITWVVAPDREQSTTSHALTLGKRLRAERVGERKFQVVEGTPTDCALLALRGIMPAKPDLVLSGVNHGSNMGEDVLYSGTVAAAMEATILGCPAVAFSFAGDDDDVMASWEPTLRTLLRSLLRRWVWPSETFLNINLPGTCSGGVEDVAMTSLGRRDYEGSVNRESDPTIHDEIMFRIGGVSANWRGSDDADFRAVDAGKVSVTPLQLDLTHSRVASEPSWSLKV